MPKNPFPPLLFTAVVTALSHPHASAFSVPNARHHHPIYVQYPLDQLGSDECTTTSSSSGDEGCDGLMTNDILVQVDATISTPVSYDEETGMVQTAVRAIVDHPLSNIVLDNSMVGLSSTLVLTTGALTEVAHCLELEWTHHATSSTEGMAILSLGHFFHYGREAIRQLVEIHEEEDDDDEVGAATHQAETQEREAVLLP